MAWLGVGRRQQGVGAAHPPAAAELGPEAGERDDRAPCGAGSRRGRGSGTGRYLLGTLGKALAHPAQTRWSGTGSFSRALLSRASAHHRASRHLIRRGRSRPGGRLGRARLDRAAARAGAPGGPAGDRRSRRPPSITACAPSRPARRRRWCERCAGPGDPLRGRCRWTCAQRRRATSRCRTPPAGCGWRRWPRRRAGVGCQRGGAGPHRRRSGRDGAVPDRARHRAARAWRASPTGAAASSGRCWTCAGPRCCAFCAGGRSPSWRIPRTATGASPAAGSGTSGCRSWPARTPAWSRRCWRWPRTARWRRRSDPSGRRRPGPGRAAAARSAQLAAAGRGTRWVSFRGGTAEVAYGRVTLRAGSPRPAGAPGRCPTA